jgi:hypothetical protein
MPSFFPNCFDEILPLGVRRTFKSFLSIGDKYALLLITIEPSKNIKEKRPRRVISVVLLLCATLGT